MRPGVLADPGTGPVVVVRVQADAVRELGARLAVEVAPGDAVGARGRRGQARQHRPQRVELARVVAVQVGQRRERAAVLRPVDLEVQGDLEALRHVGLGGRLVRGHLGVHVRGGAHALPVDQRAAGGAGSDVLLEALDRAARRGPAVVVAGEHDGGLVAVGEVPEARDRRPRRLGDQVGQQALLLVGGRDRRAGEVEPRQAAVGIAEEHVVGADESDHVAVALLALPTRGSPAGSRRPSARGRT